MKSYVTGDMFVMKPPKQTLKAWQPYSDCVSILFSLNHTDVVDGDEELPDWRIYWVAGIALLRAVGHVLAKSDALTSDKHRNEINKLWKRWREDPDDNIIFHNFIEKERNNILKTYTFGAVLSKIYGHDSGDDSKYIVTYSDGEDAFEMFREAVYWWRHQLMVLEDQL
jgi:hypothetical protein